MKKGSWDEKEFSESKEGEGEEAAAGKEGEEEEGTDNVLKQGDSSCLWSLTTDAGISRHTTIFTLGIPVILRSSDEQLLINILFL